MFTTILLLLLAAIAVGGNEICGEIVSIKDNVVTLTSEKNKINVYISGAMKMKDLIPNRTCVIILTDLSPVVVGGALRLNATHVIYSNGSIILASDIKIRQQVKSLPPPPPPPPIILDPRGPSMVSSANNSVQDSSLQYLAFVASALAAVVALRRRKLRQQSQSKFLSKKELRERLGKSK